MSFHDRAKVVADDILELTGFAQILAQVTRFLPILDILMAIPQIPLPGFSKISELQEQVRPHLPVIDKIKQHMGDDLTAYLYELPQEQIEHFLNMAITRMEWIISGNEANSKPESTEPTDTEPSSEHNYFHASR